jgi:site-specific DNA recombinase
MRVALYARYSSDQQRAASIDDQFRECRAFAEREGWTVVEEYSDAAISGASSHRPGLQALVRDARRYDIVLAESLDRLSRDMEDTAGLFKRLSFNNVKIATLAEGRDIGHLHVGLKGTMNALFLKDLADKTRRGLRGRVEAGKSGGGRSYGYRVLGPQVEAERGGMEILAEEASIVRRICRTFVAGTSPKAIAKALNVEKIPGPASAGWSPSTIHGHAGRGTGILNNELYVGKRIWNRLRYLKDPDTGRRVSRLNPRDQWIVTEVQHLRILDDDLWQAVKTRQAATRHTMQAGIDRARRPKYLFTGLTKCGECGGGFILSSHDLLTCFNARVRGTCTNRRSIKRQEVEARVLRAMKEQFFEPGAFAEFCAGFTAELNTQRREQRMKLANAPSEIFGIDRRIKEIQNLLLAGFRTESWKGELVELDARKAALTAARAEALTDPPQPALHPRMAEVFQQKAMQLAAALERDEERDAAREALRGFLDKITIPPGDGLLQVAGNLGEMLTAASGRNGSLAAAVGNDGCGGGI